MKKIIITLALAAAFLGTSFAGTPVKSKTTLKSSLLKVIKAPKFEVDKFYKVYVLIEVSENGKLTVKSINSCNAEFANHIKQELSDIYIRGNNIERNKVYQLTFSYKPKK